MNLFADIRALVLDALSALQADGALPRDLDLSPVTVEPPRDAGHGDMATNAGMALSKAAKLNSHALAEALAPKLLADPRVAGVEVAGPGFINITLSPEVWRGAVRAALVAGNDTCRARTVADYIAGMTDRFALQEHKVLTNPGARA